MKNRLKFVGCLAGFAIASTAVAQPGITAITFKDTAMSPTGSWASIPTPGFWSIGAILMDSAHHPIGFLSPLTSLSTASAPSFPTRFSVTLGESAPADSIVVVYRSTTPFSAGDTVDKAEYTGLCAPTGCAPGDLTVPISGQLPNSDFTPGASALPVKLQEFSVD